MSGSGNDFVFFDSRAHRGVADPLENREQIVALCAPHLGIGADGVVFIDDDADALFAIRYYNADGSRGELCGNASLCATQSAVALGLASAGDTFQFMSDSGLIKASIDASGLASVRLSGVEHLEVEAPESPQAGEIRVGFAEVGVPHLVILVSDVDAVDVQTRGRTLRYGSLRAPKGANVNFVSASRAEEGFRMRTYERGVEAETLACGTGSVATAACLMAWNLASRGSVVRLLTRSGRRLTVRLPDTVSGAWSELSGEGRRVFDGVLGDVR
jgi:diaminopimelate epimerase